MSTRRDSCGSGEETVVLRRSNFTEIEWKQQQKTWWKTIFIYNKLNQESFGGIGFDDYYYAVYSNKTKPAAYKDLEGWNGPERGTLFVTNYHGQLYCGFNKSKTDGGTAKIDVGTMNRLQDWISNAEYSMRGADIATAGASMVVTVPISELLETVGKVASIEKIAIQVANGDIKDAVKTVSGELIVPVAVKSIFDKWRSNTPSEKAQYKINFIEKLVNDAISKGLDSVNIPVKNNTPEVKTSKTKS